MMKCFSTKRGTTKTRNSSTLNQHLKRFKRIWERTLRRRCWIGRDSPRKTLLPSACGWKKNYSHMLERWLFPRGWGILLALFLGKCPAHSVLPTRWWPSRLVKGRTHSWKKHRVVRHWNWIRAILLSLTSTSWGKMEARQRPRSSLVRSSITCSPRQASPSISKMPSPGSTRC